MPQITISQSAIDKITSDREFRRSKEGKIDLKLPLLYYYERSYLTRHDGTVVEYGDGFTLTFVDKEELEDTTNIIYKMLDIADGVATVVGGPRSILSENFSIGWTKSKFTFEPQVSG
jgi:hypothetical protein